MAREVLAALFLATALLPVAQALEARGSFIVEGPLALPSSTTASGEGIAFFLDFDKRPVGLLVLQAAEVEVTQFWRETTGAVVAGSQVKVSAGQVTNQTRVLHNATFTLVSSQKVGYVGADLREGRSGLRLTAESGGAVTGATRTVFVSANSTNKTPSADEWHEYHATVARPHLRAEGRGAAEVEGAGRVKVSGLELEVVSDEGRMRLRTGRHETSPLHVEDSWLVLKSDAFALEVRSEAVWRTALSEAAASWSGTVTFRPVQGALATEGDTYSAEGGRVSLRGTFETSLRPELDAGGARLRLDIHGDLADTTLATASRPAAPVARDLGVLPWLGLGVGLAAVSALAGGAILRRRAARPRPAPAAARASEASAERCVGQAEACLLEGDFRKALHWILQARRAAPTSASVCSTQAFILAELGRVDEALRAFQDAARLAPAEGEHALSAARVAQQAGRPAHLVEDLLEQALARDPSFVEEIENDGLFSDLAGRPRFDHMVESAWRRFTSDLSEPE